MEIKNSIKIEELNKDNIKNNNNYMQELPKFIANNCGIILKELKHEEEDVSLDNTTKKLTNSLENGKKYFIATLNDNIIGCIAYSFATFEHMLSSIFVSEEQKKDVLTVTTKENLDQKAESLKIGSWYVDSKYSSRNRQEEGKWTNNVITNEKLNIGSKLVAQVIESSLKEQNHNYKYAIFATIEGMDTKKILDSKTKQFTHNNYNTEKGLKVEAVSNQDTNISLTLFQKNAQCLSDNETEQKTNNIDMHLVIVNKNALISCFKGNERLR